MYQAHKDTTWEIRKRLRTLPTWQLQKAYDALTAGGSTGMELIEQNRALASEYIREILWERGKMGYRVPEDDISTKMIKALVEHTINDIPIEVMNRIVHRLAGLPRNERAVPKRVADILVQELGDYEYSKLTPEQQKTTERHILGAKKALQYVETAFRSGTIKAQEYNDLRTLLIIPIPRTQIQRSEAMAQARELLSGEREMRQGLETLLKAGNTALRKPAEDLIKDIEALRRAWGIPRRQTR